MLLHIKVSCSSKLYALTYNLLKIIKFFLASNYNYAYICAMDYNAITQGVKNTLFKEKATEEKANTRLEICNSCHRKSGLVCTACGCVLQFKVRQDIDKCPLNKW